MLESKEGAVWIFEWRVSSKSKTSCVQLERKVLFPAKLFIYTRGRWSNMPMSRITAIFWIEGWSQKRPDL